jgi:apolipoprotein D and lipocalin family protein
MDSRLILACIFIWSTAEANSQALFTSDSVDMERYSGKWYEIASVTSGRSSNCHCTTAEYEYLNGRLEMIDRCIVFRKGKSKMIESGSRGYPVDGSHNAHLKISPFAAHYYILMLDRDYAWTVVSNQNQSKIRILYRDAYMPTTIYREILKELKTKGYTVESIQKTSQNCDLVGERF